ncbi:ribbon-helix-helix domain-containing protein [Candidatus Woesearchaeota archaeon]|nr:ribbon-helix-helix domain-containing protein [Candidatus Woesearchaeota archaeon]
MTSIEVLNIRLPKKIVLWLDSLVVRGLYKSRAEAIREFTREYVLSQERGSS